MVQRKEVSMNQRRNKFIMFFSLFLVAFFYHYFKIRYPEQSAIVASIDKTKISYRQLKDFASLSGLKLTKENRMFLLDQLISRKIIYRHAVESGIKEKELDKVFKKEKESVRKKLILDNFFTSMAKNEVRVKNRDIKEYYKNHRLFQLRMIYFPKNDPFSGNKIDQVYSSLNKGDDFKKVYHQFFPGKNDKKAGLIGIIDVYDIPVKLRSDILALKNTGDFTKPLDTGEHFAIYYLEKYPSMGQAKDLLVRKTREEKLKIHQERLQKEIKTSIKTNDQVFYSLIQKSSDSITRPDLFKIVGISSLTGTKLTFGDFLADFSEQYQDSLEAEPTPLKMRNYLDKILLHKVILDYAKIKDFDQNKEFLKILNNEYSSLESRQDQETIDFVINRFNSEEKKKITEKEIVAAYEKHKGLNRKPNQIQLQQIIFKDRKKAEKVFTEINKNDDFQALVEKYSQDRYVHKYKGLTAYQSSEKLSEYYPDILKYQKGDILPLREEGGLYILEKIVDVQKGAEESLDQVYDELENYVLAEHLKVWVDSLINKYHVKVRKYPRKLEIGDYKKKAWFIWNPLKK